MKPERRNWQFWIWGFVFLFLAHALAVLRFGEKQLPTQLPEPPPPFFYLSVDEASDRRIAEQTLGRDPTLFAVPNPHGFSGGAWLRFKPESPKLTNWSAPPELLPLDTADLAQTVKDYVATNRPSDEPLLASLRASRQIEILIPNEPLVTGTVARVQGALSARRLVNAPRLPAVAHSDLLQRTVVSVSVNGDGVVESASVWRASGSRQADEEAVALARAFEFEPLPIRDAAARANTPPVAGRIVFQWHVVTSTNGTTTASLP